MWRGESTEQSPAVRAGFRFAETATLFSEQWIKIEMAALHPL
jgi:hypothetical protein